MHITFHLLVQITTLDLEQKSRFSDFGPYLKICLCEFFLVIAQSEDMVVYYILFSNIEELQRVCGDVMTKKLKILQFLTYSSSISPLTRHCIKSTYRATYILHFIYWLQRYTLCLECIMFQFLNISSLYKHFFSHLYLCQLLFDLNE